MKRILVILLVIAMLASTLALAACGDEPAESSPDSSAASSDSTPTSSEPPASSENPDEPKDPDDPTNPDDPDDPTNPDDPDDPTNPDDPTDPVEPVATPNYRDAAKTYHIETRSYKTTSKNEDYEFLFINNAPSNVNERYCDHSSTLIYMIPLEGLIEPTVTLYVRQQYYIAVMPSLEAFEDEYIKIADFNDIKDTFPSSAFNEEGAYNAGTNDVEITINPYEYEIYDYLYIYIANSNPSTGHGGTIMRLDINEYKEGEGDKKEEIDNTPGSINNKEPGMVETSDVILTNGNDEDEEYIYKNVSQATDTRRFCDGNKYIIYRFDIRNLYEPVFDLYVAQNYKIEISPDGENWFEVANFATSDDYQMMYQDWQNNTDSIYNFVDSGDLESGNNFTNIIIDPYNPGGTIEPITGNLYIRISDCFPAAGWGGAIEIITIKHWVNP